MGVYPTGGGDGGGGVTGGVYQILSPSEHSRTVYCNQVHYGPVSDGGEAPGFTDIQTVVVSGRPVLGGY